MTRRAVALWLGLLAPIRIAGGCALQTQEVGAGPDADAALRDASVAGPDADVALRSDLTPGPDGWASWDLAPDLELAPPHDLGEPGSADQGPPPRPDLGPEREPDAGPPVEACPVPPHAPPVVEVRAVDRFRIVDRFPGPGLADRRVVVYLPAAYDAEPARRFPVLYLHDGQNQFHNGEATFGTAWDVDGVLDALVLAGEVEPTLLVAVDNTPDRLAEYRAGPDPTVEDGSPAAAYRRFLAEEVKPWVDAQFRTDCRRTRTALMGSSMGAVASLAAALRHPEVWGRVGLVSGAFWFGEPQGTSELPRWLEEHAPDRWPDRIWLDMGTREASGNNLDPTLYLTQGRRVRDRLLALGLQPGSQLAYWELPDRAHCEAAWQERLGLLLRWLLGPAPAARPAAPEELTLIPVASRVGRDQPGPHLLVQARYGALTQTLPCSLVELVSLTPAIAELGPDGQLLPRGVGTARLQARYQGQIAEAVVEVTGEPTRWITWRVRLPGPLDAAEAVYLAGNLPELGSWADGPAAMRRLAPVGRATWQTSLALPRGALIEYKYTRGRWNTVEKAADGTELANRRFTPGEQDATLEEEVARWADR